MRRATTTTEPETFGAQGGCTPETNLWLAVLEQVISTEEPTSAREWLTSKDGRLVAAMAGVDADWVSEKIVPACRTHPKRRDNRHLFAGNGRRGTPRPRNAPRPVPTQHPWAASWAM